MAQAIQDLRWDYLWDGLVTLVRYPNSNLSASLLLLSVVVITVLVLALTVILVVTRPSRRRAAPKRQQGALSARTNQELLTELEASTQVRTSSREPRSRGSILAMIGAGMLTTVVLLIAVGGSSSTSSVCLACHQENPHDAAVATGGTDAHADLMCVRCHEGSSWLGMLTVEVPGRLVHIANGLGEQPQGPSYGAVVSPACFRCHESISSQVTVSDERGILMAHKQPLEAGAECLDCHTIATGVISTVTSGMTPCLRCHDAEDQPTECSLCHVKDVSAAARSRTNPATLVGRSLVPTPDCGGCHNEAASCDPCHGGQRMPHTEVFMWWGHARKGVEDVWFNGGRSCGRCHTAERRPCTECHAFFPGHPVTSFPSLHGSTGSSGGCNNCHGSKAYVVGRDFCGLCHGEPIDR